MTQAGMPHTARLPVAGWLAALVLLAGCGQETPTDNGGGNGGGGNQGPLRIFDIALRPQAIARGSSLSPPLPNPEIAVYNLTAFYRGGTGETVFTWEPDSVLGTVEPKTQELSTSDAPVTLFPNILAPLGLHTIRVTGTSGGITSSFQRRFAVVEHNWMKHVRATISNPNDPPKSLVLSPTFAPGPAGDEIYFVAFPNPIAVDLWSIAADQPYAQGAQEPRTSLFVPPRCDSLECRFGYDVNPQQTPPPQELTPDLSPAGLLRDEILFTSQMDPHYERRAGAHNKDDVPYSLWVVKRPEFLGTEYSKALTFDTEYTGGQDCLVGYCFHAYDYMQPRWDRSPASPTSVARIAFISNRGGGDDIWLADLVDLNNDQRSDSLMNYRQLTHTGSVESFDWHPNGSRIYFTGNAPGIQWVDVADPSHVETLTLTRHDSLITDFAWVSVFARETTLLAFQAASENRVNLYLYDEDLDSLVRLNPFGFPVTLNLFPRWHPVRKEIVYVSDYSVARWVAGNDPTPVGSPSFVGQLRTQFPSVWTVRLEGRSNP